MAFFRAAIGGGGGSPTLKTAQIKNGTNYFSSRSQYSVDVASALPNDYQNLTLDNFSIDASSFSMQASTSQVTNDASLLLSYNNSTGILSLGKYRTRQSIGGTYYYLSLNYYIEVSYI